MSTSSPRSPSHPTGSSTTGSSDWPGDWPAQLHLPGQAPEAPGPHDLGGMYLMHFGFRRDLDAFVGAARHTPVGEVECWRALLVRWERFGEVLHHHHDVEDAHLWPALQSYAAGGEHDLLAAMEAEHDVIDPALVACREAFRAMVDHPCRDHRNALDVRLTACREALADHLVHEESQALPMVQRRLSAAEWAAFEHAAERAYPVRMTPFLIGWVADGLPPDALDRMLRQAGPAYRLLLRLVRPSYRRSTRVAFRYATA